MALRETGGRAVDIHAHFFPQAYLDVVAEEGARFGASCRVEGGNLFIKSPGGATGPISTIIVDLDARLGRMDAQGVTVQALSLTTPMAYWGDAAFSHRLCRAWNDAASAAHRAHPERFVALLGLPMRDPDRALEALMRASALPGMRGVYLGTNIDGRDLDDPLFAPAFARIETLGLPVVLHPIYTVGGARLKPFHLGNLLGNPYDTAIAAAHLIFGGVLDRHPALEISLPHAGGALPILVGRLDRGWTVRAEAKHLAHAPSSYLRRFTYDTIGHSPKVMRFVVDLVGADRLMLGSDYCYDMGYEEPVLAVEELGLSAEERALILGGTAAKLLRL
jgi:aminocarboxymuconate-semialdehyde decarboxylase